MGDFGLGIGGSIDQAMTGLKALLFQKGQDLICFPLGEGMVVICAGSWSLIHFASAFEAS